MRLVLLRGDEDGDGVAEFHDVVDQDFDVIGSGHFEFDLTEDGDVGGMQGGILKGEFDFAFAQLGDLVGSDEADGFGKLADAGGPAVKEAQFQGDDGKLGDADKVNDADQEKIPGHFLSDFFA